MGKLMRDLSKFEPVFEILRGSTIRGIVFSIYDKFGPQTLYSFPPPVEQEKDGFGYNRDERIKEKVVRLQNIGENVKEEFVEFLKSANENVFIQNLFGRLGSYIQCKNELSNAKKLLNHKSNELNCILKSRTWRWGSKFSKIFLLAVPKDSLRRKLVRQLLLQK